MSATTLAEQTNALLGAADQALIEARPEDIEELMARCFDLLRGLRKEPSTPENIAAAERLTSFLMQDDTNWRTHTPNGYDPLWILAINNCLADRDDDGVGRPRAHDLDDHVWERFIGPLVDYFEDGGTVE